VSQQDLCVTQRSLIFQGGGALGAYEAGVFKEIYNKVKGAEFMKSIEIATWTGPRYEDRKRNLQDFILLLNQMNTRSLSSKARQSLIIPTNNIINASK
jgi:hypothetical protein